MTHANAIRDRQLQCQTSLTADNENYMPPMHHLYTNPYKLQYQYQQCQRSHTLTNVATTLMGNTITNCTYKQTNINFKCSF